MENYKFIEKIGRGTHGTAYLLRSQEDNRFVVCKSVIEKYVVNARREIAILKRLSHRRVVRQLDNIQTNGSMFIILEYANYGTLEKMLQYFSRNGMASGPTLGWSILSQLSDALYYIHSKGIVHRDVKPANVLINKFPVRDSEYLEFKLCDFSLSTSLKRPGELIVDGATVGTPFYMAPEMVLKKPYGAGVDVWGLGVVVYEALRMEKPFTGGNREELYNSICTKEIRKEEPSSDLALGEMVCRCLSKENRPLASEIAKNDRVRLTLTILELKYRESRIEELEKEIRVYESKKEEKDK